MRKTPARRAALAVSLALLSIALMAPLALADLECTFPPGTPNDWFREFPERLPRLRGVAVIKPPEKPKEEPKKDDPKSGTQEKKNDPKKETLNTLTKDTAVQPELGSQTYQPMMFSGVLTVDLPFHVKFVKRVGETGPRKYPPAVTDDLYWMAQVSYLRRLLHPAMLGEHETYWHLVQLGDAGREVARGAKAERFLESLADAVLAGIPELPKDAPTVPAGGDSPEDKMLIHMVSDDLWDGDPYSLDPTYAGRTLSLGEPGFVPLQACATASHPLLRRNAVVLLGSYPQPEVVPQLVKLWKEDTDLVVKTRALFHLIKRRDSTLIPELSVLLAGDEARPRPLAAFALGHIGTKECVEPLVKAIEKWKTDWDTVVACVIGLARAGTADAATATPILKKLEEGLRKEPVFLEKQDIPRPQADIPDRDEVKNRMLLELVTIALAKIGDKDGIAKLQQILAGKYEDNKNPVGFANASGPQRADQIECMKFVCPSSYLLLVEYWGARDSKDKEAATHLAEVVLNDKANDRLRSTALRYDAVSKDKKFLMQVVATDSASLKSLALRELANVDDKAAVALAEGIIKLYSSGQPMSPKNTKGDTSVVTALEILYHAKKVKVDTIKPVLIRALGEFVYSKPDVTAEGMKPFAFSPPIIETCAWILGNLQDKNALTHLKTIATSTIAPSARAEGVRALRNVPGEPTVQLLATLLEDEDGWIRYNAYLSIKALTTQDHFCDWIYGSKDDRKDATERYKELAKKK